MRDDPGLDEAKIAACLDANYGIHVASIAFLPIGHDLNAFVHQVVARDGTCFFLKIRSGPPYEPGLLVPRALIDVGVHNVLAPLRTRSSELWCRLDEHEVFSVVLYPFIRGENAKIAGMSDEQWRAFGLALRAVHASGLETRFQGQLRTEDFALPSAALVRNVLALAGSNDFASPAAQRLAAFWRENAARVYRVLARAEELGRSLQSRSFELDLCHGDIHGANILVGEDGRIWLVDWDGPLIAPRERDLLFVVGSRIARPVEPRQEDLFFEGYGPVEIDPDALIYYRYERIVEDLGEFGKTVFLDANVSEQAREVAVELVMSLFTADGDIDRAETVPRHRWP